MDYRIVAVDDQFQIQKKVFLFFWTNCYIYRSDYSRALARYRTKEQAYSYFGLKDCLED